MKRYSLIFLAIVISFTIIACGTSPQSSSQARVQMTMKDGTIINGTLYGQGSTAIILSNGADNDLSGWSSIPQDIVSHGYMALTYTYRDTPAIIAHVPQYIADLQTIVDWTKYHGAKKVVLLGASAGGFISLMAPATLSVDAIIGISPAAAYQVSADELKTIAAPKLIIYAENDPTIISTSSTQFYDILPEPKEIKMYSGQDHGLEMFAAHTDLEPYIFQYLQSHSF
jgi:hypothetical protein